MIFFYYNIFLNEAGRGQYVLRLEYKFISKRKRIIELLTAIEFARMEELFIGEILIYYIGINLMIFHMF